MHLLAIGCSFSITENDYGFRLAKVNVTYRIWCAKTRLRKQRAHQVYESVGRAPASIDWSSGR